MNSNTLDEILSDIDLALGLLRHAKSEIEIEKAAVRSKHDDENDE